MYRRLSWFESPHPETNICGLLLLSFFISPHSFLFSDIQRKYVHVHLIVFFFFLHTPFHFCCFYNCTDFVSSIFLLIFPFFSLKFLILFLTFLANLENQLAFFFEVKINWHINQHNTPHSDVLMHMSWMILYFTRYFPSFWTMHFNKIHNYFVKV